MVKKRQADLGAASLPRDVTEPSHSSTFKHKKVPKIQRLKNTAKAFLSGNTSSGSPKYENLYQHSTVHKVKKDAGLEEEEQHSDKRLQKKKKRKWENEGKLEGSKPSPVQKQKTGTKLSNDASIEESEIEEPEIKESELESAKQPKFVKGPNKVEVCESTTPYKSPKKPKSKQQIRETLKELASSKSTKKMKSKKQIEDAPKKVASDSFANIEPEPMHVDGAGVDMGGENLQQKNFQQIYTCDGFWIMAFTKVVEIRGCVSVTALQGDVELHGYRLKKGEMLNSYSPAGYYNSLLFNCTTSLEPLSEELAKFLGPCAVANLSTFATANPRLAIVRLALLEIPEFARALLPPPESVGFLSLHEQLNISEEAVPARYEPQTLDKIDHLIQLREAGQDVRVLICGDQRVGKSTLIKFLVNKFLSQARDESGVVHMDCDPGQPEFGCPGSLTLRKVSSPLLGPAWLNEGDPDHTELYGAISPEADRDRYFACVSRLVKKYEKAYRDRPLFINTMGYIVRNGLHFLSAVIALVKPTHILQLRFDKDPINKFPDFTRDVANRYGRFLKKNRETLNKLTYDVISFNTTSPPTLKFSESLRPPLCRELKVLSYLSRCVSPVCPQLHNVTPYAVKWSNVSVSLGADATSPPQVLEVINGALVALCHADAIKSIDDQSTGLRLVSGYPGRLLGFGLVRAVDSITTTFYIMTPIGREVLDKVNVIIRVQGKLTPKSLITEQVAGVCEVTNGKMSSATRPQEDTKISNGAKGEKSDSESPEVPADATPSIITKQAMHTEPTITPLGELASTNIDPDTVQHLGIHEENLQQVYKCDGFWILAFTEVVEIRGCFSVTALRGDVELHGYRLRTDEMLNSYSTAGYYNSVLSNHTTTTTTSSEQLSDEKLAQFLGPRAVANLSTFAATYPHLAVVRIALLEIPEFARRLLPTPETVGLLSLHEELSISLKTVPARYDAQTLEEIDRLVQLREAGEDLRILVCGGKSVGKSTLIRFIINKFLSLGCHESGVVHMGCDPGQTEFGCPSCLTLRKVSSPLLGPSCLNEDDPDYAELYGAISPEANTDQYLACLSGLIKKYEESYRALPLFIDTMGYIVGLGLNYLTAAVSIVKPTHILQLRMDADPRQNFPDFNRVLANRYDIFLNPESRKALNKLSYDVIPLKTRASPIHQLKSNDCPLPVAYREIKTLSYLSRCISPACPRIHDVTPYAVNWSNIVVALGIDIISQPVVLQVIDGALVALCHAKTVKSTDDQSTGLRLASGFPGRLLGFGLVRAVDPITKTFYITTPIDRVVLDKVNIIVRVQGNLTPKTLLTEQVAGMLPYRGSKFPRIDVPLLLESGFGRTISAGRQSSRKEKQRTGLY